MRLGCEMAYFLPVFFPFQFLFFLHKYDLREMHYRSRVLEVQEVKTK